MATIKLGGGVTAIRGSMGGTTFSRNACGDYIRNRTKPVHPRSPLQNARRANLAYLAKYWSNDLTQQQRDDWIAYANATTWKNRLGDDITINGLAAFVRLNAFQLMIPSDVIPDAPTANGHGGGITLTFAAESDTTKIQLDEPGGSFDKDTERHNAWLFMGHPTEPGRIATPKGMRYIGRIWGSALNPLTYPYQLDAAYTIRAGQLVTLRAMWHDEHYRVAGPFFATETAAPSI